MHKKFNDDIFFMVMTSAMTAQGGFKVFLYIHI